MRRVKFGEKSGMAWVLLLLGIVLLAAAGLKAHQLLTEPMANADIWSNRNFHIFQVEFELVLGLWLLSGWRRKLAWLAALACFGVFSAVTVYKGFTGAASCGCFGRMHVNPWITLLAIDIPAMAVLVIFRPKFPLKKTSTPLRPEVSYSKRVPVWASLGGLVVLLTVSTTLLALNEPPKATPDYVVLEPETWIGKELPILEYIDIGDQLREGNWLILLYHHDCPDCQKAIVQYEQMARDLEGDEDYLRITLIEVPPYGHRLLNPNSRCNYGRLADVTEWFITTPTAVYMQQAVVHQMWENNPPEWRDIMEVVSVDDNKFNELKKISIF